MWQTFAGDIQLQASLIHVHDVMMGQYARHRKQDAIYTKQEILSTADGGVRRGEERSTYDSCQDEREDDGTWEDSQCTDEGDEVTYDAAKVQDCI